MEIKYHNVSDIFIFPKFFLYYVWGAVGPSCSLPLRAWHLSGSEPFKLIHYIHCMLWVPRYLLLVYNIKTSIYSTNFLQNSFLTVSTFLIILRVAKFFKTVSLNYLCHIDSKKTANPYFI